MSSELFGLPMPRHSRIANATLLSMLLVSAAAAAGAQVTPAHPTPPRPSPVIIEPAPRMRFTPIHMEFSDSARVRVPVRIDVVGSVNIPARHAKMLISIVQLSEIAYMQRHGVDARIPLPIMPQFVWEGAADSGAIRHGTIVVFPVVGLYQIQAELVSDEQPIDAGGRMIQGATGSTAWIGIGVDGAKVLRSFEEEYLYQKETHAPDPVLEFKRHPVASPIVPDTFPVID